MQKFMLNCGYTDWKYTIHMYKKKKHTQSQGKGKVCATPIVVVGSVKFQFSLPAGCSKNLMDCGRQWSTEVTK